MKWLIQLLKMLFGLSVLIFILLDLIYGQNITSNNKTELSINIKTKALVLGPKIKLGDIGVLVVPDSIKKEQLASVILGDAAPPGESREISLNYIKRCLKRAGLGEFNSYIHGPKTIRVTTAPVEMDKAIIKEGVALILNNQIYVFYYT
ncbi:MAG: hypothetical protein ACE5HX_02960 [bacterium]